MSIATPKARSRKPGQTAIIDRPPWTATVTAPFPSSTAACRARVVARSASRPAQAPLALEGLEDTGQVRGGRGEVGRGRLHVVQPHDGIEVEGPDLELLADHLAVDLAAGGHVDDGVPDDRGRAREAPAVGQAAARRVVPLDRVGRGEVPGQGRDAVLGERADALLHLAAAADPAAPADRVDVHAQRPGGVQHARAGREPPPPTRGREDDQGIGRSRHRVALSPRPAGGG